MAFLPLLVGTAHQAFVPRANAARPRALHTFFAIQPLQVAGHVATRGNQVFLLSPAFRRYNFGTTANLALYCQSLS